MVAAAGGNPTPAQAQEGGGNLLFFLALGFLAYNLVFRSAMSPSKPVLNTDGTTMAPATAIPQQEIAKPASTPDLSFLGSFADALSPKRSVPQSVQYLERKRQENLAIWGNSPRIGPYWIPSTSVDLMVCLSTSPQPLNFSTLEMPSLLAMKYEEYEEEEDENATKVSSGGLFGKLLGNSLLDMFQGPSMTKYRNSTISMESVASAETDQASTNCFWLQRGLLLTDNSGSNNRQQSFQVVLPPSVLRNESGVFAHIFFAKGGVFESITYSASPEHAIAEHIDAGNAYVLVHPLVVYKAKKPEKITVSLLGIGDDESSSEKIVPGMKKTMEFGIGAATQTPSPSPSPEPSSNAGPVNVTRMMPYWRPQLHVEIIPDNTMYARTALPPHIGRHLHVLPAKNSYLPISRVNDFWVLGHHLIALNETSTDIPLTVSFSLGSAMKFGFQEQMAAQWNAQASFGMNDEGEIDMLKGILVDTNPILLITTIIVSTLHTVFDLLAFKNDVSFWRSAKTMEGLSIKSVALNVFFQTVIFLYLLDNETSWMVLLSSGLGLLIEYWKLTKAFGGKFKFVNGKPSIEWEEKKDTQLLSDTKKYDNEAITHLLYVLAPLIVGYAGYSLVFEKHKSVYAWILQSLTGFVYVFGFAQMTPQLYINYKLKSVAAVNFRQMGYKFFNTIIDDLFAFIIKMPTMHRIACFRDDIIFLIYMYQRHIYKVDNTRRNEFGASGDDFELAEARKRGEKRVSKRGKFD
jgi:Cleft lip and palate transmembrane protein 1 (CLPTM1)